MIASVLRDSTIGFVTAVAALIACGTPSPSTGSRTTIESSGAPAVEINLEFAHDTYVIGQDVTMTVVVTNRTSADVEIPNPFHATNWQPRYSLTSPSSPNGFSFSFRSVSVGDKRPEPDDVEPVLIKLRPGQSVEEGIPLRSWIALNEPGEYAVAAKLDWKGLAVHSRPAHFRLEKAQVTTASVGVDDEAAGTPGEWVEWFHAEPAARRLYSAMFMRPHVDVRAYEAFSVDPIFTASAQATDLLSPWTNYNRQAELAKWRAWREGSTLVALATGLKEAQRLDLGAEPQTVVRPALMTRDGVLDVFVVTAGKPELALARFPKPNFRGAPSPAAVLWRLPIPLPPVAARVALSPESAGSERRVLVVAQEPAGIVVYFMNAGTAGTAGRWEITRIPNVVAMRNAQPALRVSSDGVSHAAIMVEGNTATHDFAVADLTFDRSGKLLGSAAVTPLGQLTAVPKAAAAAYVVESGSTMRRDWVVLLDDRTVVHSASGGAPRQLSVAPATPLQLVPLASGTYLLTVDANGKPAFTLLD